MITHDPEGLDWVDVSGKRMYVDADDARARALLNAGGPLHDEALLLWRHLLGSRTFDAVIDVGANYGELLLGADLPPALQIVALEPNARVVKALRETLADSHPGALVLPYALSDHDGQVTLYDDVTWWGNSTICQDWTSDRPHEWREQEVTCVAVATLLETINAGPATSVAMKLDIEGAEGAVLRDGIDALRALAACHLLVEIVRLSDEDRDWLVQTAAVRVLDTRTNTVVDLDAVAMENGVTPARALSLPFVYRRDVIAIVRE